MMVVVESPLTAEWELDPVFVKLGSFRIDIIPFVISLLKLIQQGKMRHEEQFNSFMCGMIDALNEVLEEGLEGRVMTSIEETRLRMSVTLRLYQILCGAGAPAES